MLARKMDSLHHKIKINNSYESEPSSSSGGSSHSEHNDCHLVNALVENMHLKYLINAPPSFENEVTITTTIEPEPDVSPPKYKRHIPPAITITTFKDKFEQMLSSPKKFRMASLNSSEESSFEGFSEASPFGNIQRQLYSGAPKKLAKITPGKIVFPTFYDTIMEENSCNAVDLKLSNELMEENSCNAVDLKFSYEPELPAVEEEKNSTTGENEIIIEIPATATTDLLSFNGRIKSLTLPPPPSLPPTLPSTSVKRKLSTLLELPTTSAAALLNYSQLSESFILKKYSNEKSPDLFGEDDDDDEEDDDDVDVVEVDIDGDVDVSAELIKHEDDDVHCDTSANQSLNYCPTESSFADDQTLDCTNFSLTAPTGGALLGSEESTQSLYRQNCRRERELLRRVRKCLAGIPPPPSMTIPQLDLISAVLSRKKDIFNFFNNKEAPSTSSAAAASARAPVFSLFKPTHTLAETQAMPWKDVLGVRQHGLSFNLSKSSESSDYLSLAVVDRFIGAETASSYCNSPSSAKKRISRLKMLTQSPGNRLSHLAKRRAVFSSANLATTSQKTSGPVGPQILLDKRKQKHRRKATPKRMTPGSKKKHRKTPSSSARKRLFRCDLFNKPTIASRETSKRALFQSPIKQLPPAPKPPVPRINPALANRVEKSKRALFSSDDNDLPSTSSAYLHSSMKLDSLLLKRKRNPADDDDAVGNSKMFCSENLTPRSLKIKSQSFCGGAGSSSTAAAAVSTLAANGNSTCNSSNLASSRNSLGYYSSSSSSQLRCSSSGSMPRAHSDMSACSSTNSLSENQRKKLLWAVSQALQERKIAGTHVSFKEYASVLARVVRRIFQEYYQNGSASTSETMLRLAKKHVFTVTSGKNEDDIYFQAKAQLNEIKRLSSVRPAGYIGREEYQKRRQQSSLSQTQSHLSQQLDAAENSIDSFGFSQTSAVGGGLGTSQSSFLGNNFSQEMELAMISKQFPIQPNAALQNSSSKNNLGGLALRENVDCEQRRASAQKNYFTGKDQRNVSPYATTSAASTTRLGSALKATTQTQMFAELKTNTTATTSLMTAAAKAKRQITFDS